ncbi:hypothetical protein D3C76_1856980 [compost metagenome]
MTHHGIENAGRRKPPKIIENNVSARTLDFLTQRRSQLFGRLVEADKCIGPQIT